MLRPVLIIAGLAASFMAGRYVPASQPAASSGTAPPPAAAGVAVTSPLSAGKGQVVPESAPAAAPPTTPGMKKLQDTLESLVDKNEMGEAISTLAQWMGTDPDAVIAFLAASPNRDAILKTLTAIWAQRDSAAASAWLAGNPAHPCRDTMTAGLVAAVAKDDPAAAVKWVSSMKDPVLKTAAAQDAGYEFYRHGDAEAAQSLAEMGLPASSSPALMEGWRERFENVARRNAQNLVSVWSASRAAGSEIAAGSVEEIRALLSAGVNGAGAFSGSKFQVDTSDHTPREVSASSSHIQFSEDTLTYMP